MVHMNRGIKKRKEIKQRIMCYVDKVMDRTTIMKGCEVTPEGRQTVRAGLEATGALFGQG